jgi:uncharacterized membrane protein YdjX (TVP38/TMEM64 family)
MGRIDESRAPAAGIVSSAGSCTVDCGLASSICQQILNELEMREYFSTTKEMIGLFVFLAIFLCISFFSKVFSQELRVLIGFKFPFGLLSYVFLVILGETLIPVSTLPFLPIASMLWGSFLTAYATIFAWMVSAIIDFALARRYGRPLVNRIVGKEETSNIGRSIPEEHLIWSVILFRLIFPIGLVSYALGLFAPMRWSSYLLSTAIGVVFFAFLLTQILTWPLPYRMLAETAGIIATILGYVWVRRRVLRQFENKRKQ